MLKMVFREAIFLKKVGWDKPRPSQYIPPGLKTGTPLPVESENPKERKMMKKMLKKDVCRCCYRCWCNLNC
jgi:hypothetical protein